MKLQDYLHYYLGCDYWTNNSQGNLNAKTLPDVIDMCERGKGVQLHLRRLEDITEDEAREFLKQAIPGAEYLEKNEYAVIWRSQGSRADIWFMHGPPAGFHYLLQNHFDVFGLIDAGLAIDAKNITQ
jgi:hypothetical protein